LQILRRENQFLSGPCKAEEIPLVLRWLVTTLFLVLISIFLSHFTAGRPCS
jgi:hypothetical protein